MCTPQQSTSSKYVYQLDADKPGSSGFPTAAFAFIAIAGAFVLLLVAFIVYQRRKKKIEAQTIRLEEARAQSNGTLVPNPLYNGKLTSANVSGAYKQGPIVV